MRLKIYTGFSMKSAMDEVRKDLGDNAIIVNIDRHSIGNPVRITAALDDAMHEAIDPKILFSNEVLDYQPDHFNDILNFHNLEPTLHCSLKNASMARSNSTMQEALTLGLDSLFKFKAINTSTQNTLMLIGQAGQGKTLAAVKLATQARLAHQSARIITTDSSAAGALEQLKVFCQPLDINLVTARNFTELLEYTEHDYNGMTVIDTEGVNPYALDELKSLAKFGSTSKIELVWVFAANSDQTDISESAEIFKSMGVNRFIATRCDTARRYSTILKTLSKAQMALAALSASPYIADPLISGTAHALAMAMIGKVSMKPTAMAPKLKVAS